MPELKKVSLEETNISIVDINKFSDIQENLTFSQSVDKNNENSMINTSLLDDRSMEPVPIGLSKSGKNKNITHPTTDVIALPTPENTDPRNTESLRIYLEKECFPDSEWSN